MMRKIHMLCLACITVLAFSAVLATMASAETTLEALWLVGGVAVVENLAAESSGEVTLEDNRVPIIGNDAILCSGILVGTIGPGGSGLIEAELNLALELISNGSLEGLALLCSAILGCEAASEASPIEDWPTGLPWSALIFLTESGVVLGLVEKAGTDVLCLVLGTMQEDLCEAVNATAEIVNEPTAEILAGEVELPFATCTLGGEGSGVITADVLGLFTLAGGGELTVSSE